VAIGAICFRAAPALFPFSAVQQRYANDRAGNQNLDQQNHENDPDFLLPFPGF
jgi:hypothetical protein